MDLWWVNEGREEGGEKEGRKEGRNGGEVMLNLVFI